MSTRISGRLLKFGLKDGANRVRVLDLSFEENAVLHAIAVQKAFADHNGASVMKACTSESLEENGDFSEAPFMKSHGSGETEG